MPTQEPAIRVLIVEDEPLTREVCAEYLRAVGAEVESASDEAEANAAARRFAPEVLVCDWQLKKNTDGTKLAKTLQQRHACKVVMITGQPLEKLAEHAVDLEVHRVLRKPFPLRALNEAILSTRL